MAENSDKKNGADGAEMSGWAANMPQLSRDKLENVSLVAVVSQLKKSQREKLIAGYDLKSLAKVFEDEDMMKTADKFLECGMNVCRAARELYMHRNTLVYRLHTIRRLTGFDLKDFDAAVTFRILHTLYLMR